MRSAKETLEIMRIFAKENPNESLLKEYYDNFVILATLAQVIIDGCKREYEIDGEEEIKRISKLPCMSLTKTIEVDDGKFKTILKIKITSKKQVGFTNPTLIIF